MDAESKTRGGLNLLIFREGRRIVSAKGLKSALFRQLESLPSHVTAESRRSDGFHDAAVNAILRAGELECAAVDSGALPNLFEVLTDGLADLLLSGLGSRYIPNNIKILKLEASLEAVFLPETLAVSTPEGFAYYGLHPLAYADVLENLKPCPKRIAVIGIRSIGATLSAVCAAAARKRGAQAERITVRPTGHPYDRHTEFSPAQVEFVRGEIAAGANFLIVDEGPGLSGSSLLSVGEALLQAGVSREKITFLCSHEPIAEALCAPAGPRRWREFRSIAVTAGAQVRKPLNAQVWIGGGEWRRYLFPPGFVPQASGWPASWTSFERPKYLSSRTATADSAVTPDSEIRIFKFLGLGHYGEQVIEREARVAAAGFAPPPRIESDGYASYPLLSGRPMRPEDLSESALARMAAYCAFRLQDFSAEASLFDSLQQMAEHNLKELRFEIPVKLTMEQPVLVDGRMQPHEWLLMASGQMLKTDSGGHSDDHFFPGVADMAWDLAGAMVEWKMETYQAATFLEMYRRASGDDAAPRIPEFIKAYAAFRCAYCMMAANAMHGTEEQDRLERAAANYGAVLEQFQSCEARARDLTPII